MILLVLWDGHLARPLYFWGRQDVQPTRFILIFLDFGADRMSNPQDLF